mmetsp:Transcript_7896/g.15498  ORF Transcript_7896/g.15498 Transcript_7896/m.15498 type:complete len:90 (-) Transcript_7896:817-1086(-)
MNIVWMLGADQGGEAKEGAGDPVADWNTFRTQSFDAKHRNELQALFNGICEKISQLISSSCSANVVNTITVNTQIQSQHDVTIFFGRMI